ncbi:TRAP transporter small permease [Alcaligenes sp. 13f]|uniref:TRAP transporter small permease n=1 Tax=Alcaligenes sp. 13f TaxID=2841924 RepID=UPI001CF698F1|nr:TRAP transporter small permease subunit [Alcaligenes sp. 13f]MCB4321560.1 TRAP transporter small permease [Alcaligenes sp. 13f]
MSLLRFLKKTTEWYSKIGFYFGCIVLVIMVGHVSIDVLARNLFKTSVPGTLEIVSNWYMVIVTFCPLAFLQLSKGHIVVDVATFHLNNRIKNLLDAIMSGFTFILTSIWFLSAIDLATRRTLQHEYVEYGLSTLPIWPVRWIYVASILGIFLASFITTVIYFNQIQKK